jgi:hypothetical protein
MDKSLKPRPARRPQSIPFEIWKQIFTLLFDIRHPVDRRRSPKPDLKKVCLTCSYFREVAQPLLFENVEVSLSRWTEQELEERSARLCRLIKERDASPWIHGFYLSGILYNFHRPPGQNVVRAFTAMLHIQHVQFTKILISPELWKHTLQILSAGTLQSLVIADAALDRYAADPSSISAKLSFRSFESHSLTT